MRKVTTLSLGRCSYYLHWPSIMFAICDQSSQKWRQVSSEGGVGGGVGAGVAADPNIVSISFANKLDLPHF